jgi:uncharacterized protein (TIGR03083 family)
MTSTRLTSQQYLGHLHADGERLITAAMDTLDRPVPACPDWTVDDLVVHVGSVYSHKRAVLRLGRRPAQGEWELPAEGMTPEDHLGWCHAQLHCLASELFHRDPLEPAWTWHAADQTAGFWQRRMAMETVVHRIDAEQAAGALTDVDPALAADGVDELVHVMLAGRALPACEGPEREGGELSVSIAGVRVVAPAPDLLLWLWRRAPDEVVACDGDLAVASAVLADGVP